uniref:CLV1 n=1 Tax=Arundo donax TaxID=35708 RepID=A0A0A8ZNJ8_ARUDO
MGSVGGFLRPSAISPGCRPYRWSPTISPGRCRRRSAGSGISPGSTSAATHSPARSRRSSWAAPPSPPSTSAATVSPVRYQTPSRR